MHFHVNPQSLFATADDLVYLHVAVRAALIDRILHIKMVLWPSCCREELVNVVRQRVVHGTLHWRPSEAV